MAGQTVNAAGTVTDSGLKKYNESMLVHDIIVALSQWVKLMRANVGSVKTQDGRWFRTGLPKGFPDLFGTLPAYMTNSKTAIPVFIECKIDNNKPSPEQVRFISDELAKGSIAGVCYSVKDAINLISPHITEAMLEKNHLYIKLINKERQ